MSAYEKIYAIARQIPPGCVATYRQIAQLAGLPGQARLVGYALYRLDANCLDIPCCPFEHSLQQIQDRPTTQSSVSSV